MHYSVITIFPELFEPFSEKGLLSRGIADRAVELETKHLRDYAINSQGQIDDTPYGGGSGMLLRPEPAAAAIRDCKGKRPKAKVVLFTPRGKPLTQAFAKQLVDENNEPDGGLILLCSRYEGVDERIAEQMVDYQVSLGDFVMMGGEVAAMALIESTARLLPGVLGNPDSIADESFQKGLLEYPQYTKPQEFDGHQVPEVLMSGHHQQIADWRAEQSLACTRERRPDLLGGRVGCVPAHEVSLALIHHPVLNKEGKIITSSVTNLDLHDIARSARTYGISRYLHRTSNKNDAKVNSPYFRTLVRWLRS